MNNNVSSQFHSIIANGNYGTRLRIYSISESVDCTDDADVVANGTLLVANVGDTDSNARISQAGVKLVDYFNKSTDIEIGETVSCQMSMTLMNQDGALDAFSYGKFKAYLDVQNGLAWETASLGVFYFDKPTKRRVQLVSVTARDQMQKLDADASAWWNSIDFGSGVTLQAILNSLVDAVGIAADTNTSTALVNGSYEYTQQPFDAEELTYRDVLAWIAGAAGGIARFDRNGFLTIRFFEIALIGTPVADNSIVGYAIVGTALVGNSAYPIYQLNPNTTGSGVFSLDIAEYDVQPIDKLVVKSSDTDFGTIVGNGTNAYELINDPFMYGETSISIVPRAENILRVLESLREYNPITISALADWSIEAGDIIFVYTDNTMYMLPIFQQTIVWNGVSVVSTMASSGSENRGVNSKQNRMDFRAKRSVHQLEITAENLLSMIQSTDGNYSSISQEVSNIVSTVAEMSDALANAQSEITQTANDVTIGFNNTSNEFGNIYSFIRFVSALPGVRAGGIVIGTSDNPIKLKLESEILYFFSGSEETATSADAIAYFDTSKMFADNATITNISLGTETQALDVRIMGSGDNVCAFFGGRLG